MNLMREFLRAQSERAAENLHSAFANELIPAISECYLQVLPLVGGATNSKLVAQIILVCHRAFLSASASILRGAPDDAAPATRRAMEAARVALAVSIDVENGNEWVQFEKREGRWQHRLRGERPGRPVQVRFRGLDGEPLAGEIDRWIGMMSDSQVHFTPEFFVNLDWELRRPEGDDPEIHLNYLQNDERKIEQAHLSTCAANILILKVLDRSLGGILVRDASFIAAFESMRATAKRLDDEYKRKFPNAASALIDDTAPVPSE